MKIRQSTGKGQELRMKERRRTTRKLFAMKEIMGKGRLKGCRRCMMMKLKQKDIQMTKMWHMQRTR